MLGAVTLGVLEERDLRLLWLGQATSAFGSGLVPVALAFAVIDLTASTATLILVLSVALASGVGVLLFGGVVADRGAAWSSTISTVAHVSIVTDPRPGRH
jgi:hypothetical protein